MERYVIVCLIYGEALEYHEKLVSNICSSFNVKRQRLPAHFTIKAPFETDKIEELEAFTADFCNKNNSTPITIKDFAHFRDNVIYMDILPSADAISVHNTYIDMLKEVHWLEWKKNEGKSKVFHCTLVSKLPSGAFKEIWNYISELKCFFKLYFDNISLLRWEKDKWVLYKQYKFKNER